MNERMPPCKCGRYHFPHRRTWACADYELAQELERGLADDDNKAIVNSDNAMRGRDLRGMWPR